MAALRIPPVLHPKQRGPGGGYVWLTIKLKDFIFQQRHSTLFVVDRKHNNLNITQLKGPLKLIKLKMSAKAEGQHVSGCLQDELALPHSFFTRPQDSLAHPYKPTTSPYLALYTKMIAHLGLGGPIQTVSEVMILSISPSDPSNSLLSLLSTKSIWWSFADWRGRWSLLPILKRWGGPVQKVGMKW